MKDKKAVILLHGLTGSPVELKWVAKDFKRAGYDVFTPILPGHCSSIEKLKGIK
ncbi:MAG: alpha/beta fold hydrolase [Hydrogenothermaceae bacterium]